MTISRFNKEPSTIIGTGANLDNPTKVVSMSIPDENRKRGMIVVGTTGVGKTRLAENMIDQDLKKGYSVVYIDPKVDQAILSKIYDCARKYDRVEELQLVTPVYPEYSALVDPMAYYFMVDELVEHITAAIPPSKEPFFQKVAVELSTAVIMANQLIAQHNGHIPNHGLDHIRHMIRRDTLANLELELKGLKTEEGNRVAGMIKDILNSSQEHLSKISISMRTALMELTSGNIGKIIGQADSNRFIKRLEEGKRVILVVQLGSMIIGEASRTLGRVLVSMIQKYIGRVYNSCREKVEPPLAIYIDEAQKVLYQGIESLPAMAGSANVMTTFFVQDVAQLSAVLGKEFGQIILNTCNTKIFFRCPDAETSEYVTKHFGTRNVLTGIYGANQVTTREVEQDCIKPYDVLSLQNREILMLTYTGRWKGITAETPASERKVVYPEAPTAVTNIQHEGEPGVEEAAI